MRGQHVVGPGEGWESKPIKIKLKMLRYGLLSVGWLVPLAVVAGLGSYKASFRIGESLFYSLLAGMLLVEVVLLITTLYHLCTEVPQQRHVKIAKRLARYFADESTTDHK